MKWFLFCFLLFIFIDTEAQKKVLEHSVYDSWQSVGERKISSDGKWLAFTVDPQEGDGMMTVRKKDESISYYIARGYQGSFSMDAQFYFALVKPLFSSTRDARIKKKKTEDFPKDSLVHIDLRKGDLKKYANVRSYSLPLKSSNAVAIHFNKEVDTITRKGEAIDEGSKVMVINLLNGRQREFTHISELKWSENGKLLSMEFRAFKKDSLSKNGILIYRALEDKIDTIARGGNEFMNMVFDENAFQLVFTAERDSSLNAAHKFFKLWYWKNGLDSAKMLVDRNSVGMKLNWSVSATARNYFNKNGDRVFFGTAPVKAPADTTLPEIDRVKLDVWHYNDPVIQPAQLVNLEQELKKSYLAVFDIPFSKMIQLADENVSEIITGEGLGNYYLGISELGNQLQSQWTGNVLKNIYAIDVRDGKRIFIQKNISGSPLLSADENYIFWYDHTSKCYYTWANNKLTNVSIKMKYPIWDEENDVPDEPGPYGYAGWLRNDKALLIYDRFDMWKLDPSGLKNPECITKGIGRRTQTKFRYLDLDPDIKYIDTTHSILLRSHQEHSKSSGIYSLSFVNDFLLTKELDGNFLLGQIIKAKQKDILLYTKETFINSPDLYVLDMPGMESRITSINQQQQNYNWGTVELYHWKAYDGRMGDGMVFKPENFEIGKKYPMIVYFYEKDSDSLFKYRPPAPTPSRLNIAFFVSRGYIVFVPDIRYKEGYPGKSSFDYVVSGARSMVKKGWVDSTKIGIQGQSWGGYQLSYIITRTNLFAAAWAGAPVVNMTSAYGGIRWGTGINRQFQYEKTQSRIGATLWQKQKLYLENSPLFYLPNVKTPLVIMANDQDDAVPWYQGIEFYTAMRRLGKKVWLLNYNGEKHNLVERKNRKDISIREQQYFDWLLKGEKPTRWLTEGIPAVEKGRDMGLN